MKQEIEIEFKNLVTKEEFELLTDTFSLHNSFISQTNYYFDTEALSLKDHGAALRIRVKKNTYTLTLKQPHDVGLFETHETLTKDEAMRIIDEGLIPNSTIASRIEALGISPSSLTYLGELTTSRAETEYEGGVLVLDHSHYLSCNDYELEYEVTDEAAGYTSFISLLETYCIPKRKTDNKIKRFFLQKQKEATQ
ncbi:CYTH domain-containing protein [Priestia taiwanensis]|uniref:CYTH domain-containing protein n=1 Tax=Priestia taiwanensis TaxID=1347902 RepID=A0A917AUV6_9BACI|nr:CYTH domain-containing protein [Priestia taiwanensis]MBM7364134.1 uncharacterized protein YjbK [Priestia taiwanensis]GGE71832.1 CYTH domain-containing protein [Priestia taiwanensis]